MTAVEATKISEVDLNIKSEICKLLAAYGADTNVIGLVGSWHDTLPAEIILSDLRKINAAFNRPVTSVILKQSK